MVFKTVFELALLTIAFLNWECQARADTELLMFAEDEWQLRTAMASVGPGDSIQLGNNSEIHLHDPIRTTRNGTKDKPITVYGSGVKKTTIALFQDANFIIDHSHWRFERFHLRGMNGPSIVVNSCAEDTVLNLILFDGGNPSILSQGKNVRMSGLSFVVDHQAIIHNGTVHDMSGQVNITHSYFVPKILPKYLTGKGITIEGDNALIDENTFSSNDEHTFWDFWTDLRHSKAVISNNSGEYVLNGGFVISDDNPNEAYDSKNVPDSTVLPFPGVYNFSHNHCNIKAVSWCIEVLNPSGVRISSRGNTFKNGIGLIHTNTSFPVSVLEEPETRVSTSTSILKVTLILTSVAICLILLFVGFKLVRRFNIII